MTFRKSALILLSGKGAPYVADHQVQQSLGTTEIVTFDICTGEQIQSKRCNRKMAVEKVKTNYKDGK
jgi:hypothetical protein